MWSNPRLSLLIYALVATGLLVSFCATVLMKGQHPDWFRAAPVLVAAALLNYLAAGFHLVRWLR
jgi:hypothetical protein